MNNLHANSTPSFKARLIEESFSDMASRVKNDLTRNWKPYAKGAALGGIGMMLGNHFNNAESPITTDSHEVIQPQSQPQPENQYINKNPQFELPSFSSEGNNVTPVPNSRPDLDLGNQPEPLSQADIDYFTKMAQGNRGQEIYNNLAGPVNKALNQAAEVEPTTPAPITPIDTSWYDRPPVALAPVAPASATTTPETLAPVAHAPVEPNILSQTDIDYFTKMAQGNRGQEIYNNLAGPVNNALNQAAAVEPATSAPTTPIDTSWYNRPPVALAPVAPATPVDNSSPISPIIYDSRKAPEFSLPNPSSENDNVTRAPTTKPDLNLGNNVSTPTTHAHVRQYNAPIMIDLGEPAEFKLPNSSHESNNITRAPTTKPGFEDQASSKPQKDSSNNFTKRHILDKYSDPHSPYYHRIHA